MNALTARSEDFAQAGMPGNMRLIPGAQHHMRRVLGARRDTETRGGT